MIRKHKLTWASTWVKVAEELHTQHGDVERSSCLRFKASFALFYTCGSCEHPWGHVVIPSLGHRLFARL